jgi:hypothetical protein
MELLEQNPYLVRSMKWMLVLVVVLLYAYVVGVASYRIASHRILSCCFLVSSHLISSHLISSHLRSSHLLCDLMLSAAVHICPC